MDGISGWLLVYLVASVPASLFYSVGVAGRFSDYHPGLVAGVFLVLATPLVLLVLEHPSAPAWNIASLWAGAGSVSLIVVVGALSTDKTRLAEVRMIATTIVFLSTAWAIAWTAYFLTSKRVAMTFT